MFMSCYHQVIDRNWAAASAANSGALMRWGILINCLFSELLKLAFMSLKSASVDSGLQNGISGAFSVAE